MDWYLGRIDNWLHCKFELVLKDYNTVEATECDHFWPDWNW